MSMLSRNTSMRGAQADNSARLGGLLGPSAVENDDSPTHGSVAEMMMALAETKVTCAEVQGKLTAARRDLARMREVNASLTAQVATLTDERDGSWEEVRSALLCRASVPPFKCLPPVGKRCYRPKRCIAACCARGLWWV